jgi:predicted NUDIX family NTP pyrophosphohydrolase
MSKRSAGLLMYRRTGSEVEAFLVHPGGPLWVRRDMGAWTIPKGQYLDGEEEPLDAAKREFEEETGFTPKGEFTPLGDLRQPSGKLVTAWAFEGDCDPKELKSNTFTMEWPPRSGRQIVAPEIDRGGWFSMAEARLRLLPGQRPFLDRLLERIP